MINQPGPAATVVEVATDEFLPPTHALDLIDEAPAGSVICIGIAGGEPDVAVWGGLMTAGAFANGHVGTVRETVAQCDLFLPRLEDAEQLTGLADGDTIVDGCLAAGAPQVVLKLGREGALVATPRQRAHVAGFAVDAVDATGAGDCFAGALLARLAASDGMDDAVAYANAAAALTTTGYGAVAPIPRPDPVRALLAAG